MYIAEEVRTNRSGARQRMASVFLTPGAKDREREREREMGALSVWKKRASGKSCSTANDREALVLVLSFVGPGG